MSKKRIVTTLLERPAVQEWYFILDEQPRRILVTAHYECHDALVPVWSDNRAILSQVDRDGNYWTRGLCELCQLIAAYGAESEEDHA